MNSNLCYHSSSYPYPNFSYLTRIQFKIFCPTFIYCSFHCTLLQLLQNFFEYQPILTFSTLSWFNLFHLILTQSKLFHIIFIQYLPYCTLALRMLYILNLFLDTDVIHFCLTLSWSKPSITFLLYDSLTWSSRLQLLS